MILNFKQFNESNDSNVVATFLKNWEIEYEVETLIGREFYKFKLGGDIITSDVTAEINRLCKYLNIFVVDESMDRDGAFNSLGMRYIPAKYKDTDLTTLTFRIASDRFNIVEELKAKGVEIDLPLIKRDLITYDEVNIEFNGLEELLEVFVRNKDSYNYKLLSDNLSDEDVKNSYDDDLKELSEEEIEEVKLEEFLDVKFNFFGKIEFSLKTYFEFEFDYDSAELSINFDLHRILEDLGSSITDEKLSDLIKEYIKKYYSDAI